MSSATGNLTIRRRVSWTPMWLVLAYAVVAALWKIYFQVDLRLWAWETEAFFWSPWSAGIALVVWTTWGTTPVSRLPAAFLAALGIAILFQCTIWTLPFRDRLANWSSPAFSGTNVGGPLLAETMILLALVRSLTGMRLANPEGSPPSDASRWRYHIRHIVIITAIAGFILAALTQLFPSFDIRTGSRVLAAPSINYWILVVWLPPACLVILPVAVTAAFSWKWLPATSAIAVLFWWIVVVCVQCFGGPPYESLASFTADTIKTTISTIIFLAPITAHAAALLLVLRWQGYRLTRTPSNCQKEPIETPKKPAFS